MDNLVLEIIIYLVFLISLFLNVYLYLKNKKLTEINKYYADMYADCAEILADLVVEDDNFSKYLEDDGGYKDEYETKLVENRPKSA